MYALFMSGVRWAWLITLIDIGFTAVAILMLYFPIRGTEQIWFIVHRIWYLVHLPMADLASGLLSNLMPQESTIVPYITLDLSYIVACVAQTFVIGFIFGIFLNRTRQ